MNAIVVMRAINNLSTLFTQNHRTDSDTRRVSIRFIPTEVPNILKTVYRRHDMQIVNSNDNKMKNVLGSTKDNVNE